MNCNCDVGVGGKINLVDSSNSIWGIVLDDQTGLLHALGNIVGWDAPSGTAAVLGAVLASLFSALSAYFIFKRTIANERSRLERKEYLVRANMAIVAMYKAIGLIDLAIKTASAFENPIRQKFPDQTPLSLYEHVYASVDTLPRPEPLKIQEISFLLNEGHVELMGQMLELERWAVHLLHIDRSYSGIREEWGRWSLENSITASEDDEILSVVMPKSKAVEAKVRTTSMNTLIKEALRCGLDVPRHQNVLNDYISFCRKNFPDVFSQVSHLVYIK